MLRVMADASSLERRRASRIPVAIAVELRDEHGFSLHSSSDISDGGAFFDRAIPHKVGHRLTVSFTLPGDRRPIVCEGEVVNVPDANEYGMGVRFLLMGDEDRRRLVAFIQQMGG